MGKRKNKHEFINDAIKIHGDKYNYSLVDYINNKTKVKIICKKHGIFEQRPDNHLKGSNCPICKNYKTSVRCKKTKNEFINDAIKIHGYKYDYSLVDYINNSIKVKIICKKHGYFMMKILKKYMI